MPTLRDTMRDGLRYGLRDDWDDSVVATPTPTPPSGPDWTGISAPIVVDSYATLFFQNADGTGAVTGHNDLVRSIRHPVAPNPIVWAMPGSGAAPWKLVIIGGIPYLAPNDLAESALEYNHGSATAFFNFGLRLKSNTLGSNDRIFSPRAAGNAFYLSQKTGDFIELWNGGGDVMNSSAVFGAGGVGGTLDGYISNANTTAEPTPQAYARYRTGSTNHLLSGGGLPSAASPGAGTVNGIRLGANDIEFADACADVLIRGGYWHQTDSQPNMLSASRIAELNAWMESLTL